MSTSPPLVTSEASKELSIGTILLVLAVTTLGRTLQQSGGLLSSIGLLGVTAVFIESWLARLEPPHREHGLMQLLPAMCVGVQAALLLIDNLVAVAQPSAKVAFVGAVASASVAAGLSFVLERRHDRLLFLIACICLALAGVCVIRGLRVPRIDVLVFQRESVAALSHALSPYSITFADPYTAAESARFYGRGVSVNRVLQFGYPYMPLTLLFAALGQLLGDVRYASLGAIIVASGLIASARPSRASTVAGLLLLFTPAMPMMIYHAWNESYAVLLVAAVWFTQCRAPRLLPFAAGLLFASKQYFVVAAPLLVLLIPRPWSVAAFWRFGWRAALAASLVTLPFVLWDPHGFMNSVVWLQFRQPFRHDALSYLVWLNPEHPERFLALPFVLSGLSSAFLLWRSRARPVSFPYALTLCMLPFFAFNKQAFFNYYFLILGCLACAIAAQPETSAHPIADPVAI